jgi:pimeloyl-ACP methyl ester carboxylesterase
VPTVFVAGEDSDVLTPADLAFMRKHFAVNIVVQKGSHLFPLEQPQATAALIMAQLAG